MLRYKLINKKLSVTIISFLGIITVGAFALSGNTPESQQQLAAELAVTPAGERMLIAASNTDKNKTLHDYSPRYPDPVYEDLGLDETSASIDAIQEQINEQMDTCIQDAQQAHTQLIGFKQQEEEIDLQIDQLQEQRRAIPPTIEDRQAQRDAIEAQIDQLDAQKDALRDTFNEARRAMNAANTECRRAVRDMERTKSELERQLDKQFRDSVNLRV